LYNNKYIPFRGMNTTMGELLVSNVSAYVLVLCRMVAASLNHS